MRFAFFSTDDVLGGAAKATYLVHDAMRRKGHTSTLFVRRKQSQDPDVIEVPVSATRYRIDRLARLVRLRERRPAIRYYNFNFDDETLLDRRMLLRFPRGAFDVLCLDWIAGLLTTRCVRMLYRHYGAPILWTLSDQEPVGGGCHYPLGCERWRDCCGCCPQLVPSGERDMSRQVWLRKRRNLGSLPILYRCGSQASVQRVRESGLLGGRSCVVVPGLVDEEVFAPLTTGVAREALGLPMGKRILVFGAAVLDDRRKGIAMLMDAFRKLHDSMRAGAIARCSVGDVLLVVLGHGGSDLVTALPFAHTCLGYVHDERLLRLVYAAADYYVNPSLEDEGPMMLVQSLMCGTPAVSTPTLQAQDIVVSGVTGFLCGAVTADALAEALREALAWPRHGEMRVAARQAALTAVSREVFVSRYLAAVSGWVDRHSMA